jgi:hypothetical protein
MALGGVNTASASTQNLDCTSAATIRASNNSTNIAGATTDNRGTVTAAEVARCLATLTLANNQPALRALADLIDNDLGGDFSTTLSQNTDLAASGIATLLKARNANQNISVSPDISRNNLGQVLIFPYYTTRGRKSSLINIFNTSDRTVATKVRFHESHNSRDVLDFTLVLSPYDKWSGTISDRADGTTVLTTSDSSCTVPAIPAAGQPLNPYSYNDSVVGDRGSDQTADRLREGYVEVIAMGHATEAQFPAATTPTGTGNLLYAGAAAGNTPVTTLLPGNIGNTAYYAKHVQNGTETRPRDCAAVAAAFVAGSNGTPSVALSAPATGNSGNTSAQAMFYPLGNGNNPLRGALTIISTETGVGFGTAAVAIENFNNSTNLISAQTPPYFHEPSLASRNGLWTTSGLPVIEAILSAGTIINEWSHNERNGANTDWIIQFPTKAFHVDIPYHPTPVAPASALSSCRDDNVQAARNKFRGNLTCGNTATSMYADGSGGTFLAPFENRFGAEGSLVTIGTTIIDSEENTDTAAGGVVFSPARSSPAPSIPYESNVVTFSGTGGKSVMSATPELSLDPVGSTLITERSGMARITFPNAGVIGLPVVGFVAKQRDQGDKTLSFGQIMKHSMIR